MDFYATAIVEIAVELLFWIKGTLAGKRRVKGRSSVPLVTPPITPST